MKNPHDDWHSSIPRLWGIVDLLCISVAVVVAQLARFGASSDPELAGAVPTNYWLVTVLIGLLWWAALAGWQSRDVKILGAGAEEYKRVAVASLYLFGAIAIVSYAGEIPTARGYVGVALPLGIFLLLASRWFMRKWLIRRRAAGRFTRKLLLIGAPSAVEHLHENLSRDFGAGYTPVAAILPGHSLHSPTGQELQLPVVSVSSELPAVLEAIEATNVDAIAISAGSHLKPRVIQQLGWELQDRGVSMIMAPALTGVAGPRIHTQPVAGLPLIHVTTPKLNGASSLVKRTFDIAGSGLALLAISPILLVTALLVRAGSPGPAFFQQERVGKHGETFRMHKFRSMVVDAEERLAALQEATEGNGTLFKMKADPRITRLGAFIRRYSIDELPQLWNVFMGDMSMVGPRPPLVSEVETYEKYVLRRLMVKPGITGLWQVSGRSDLSWNDSVRLDLYYVENWSLMSDLIILFRTAKAVLGKDGAY
ncbi:sugar transferase [Arthrobacter rhombi]|uniref:sugar transferase n=1 Tax=Arthrobacter rhombi TaxID=71253 RepID=UPI003FD6A26E